MIECDGPQESSTTATRESPRPGVSLTIRNTDGRRTVLVGGEIDLGSSSTLHSACIADDSHDVVVDLHDARFLDCSGYGALLAARHELEDRGGSLTWSAPTGQPARFLALLGSLEQTA